MCIICWAKNKTNIAMKKILTICFIFCNLALHAQLPALKFETSDGTQTPTYFEIINWWKKADQLSPKITMKPMGMTDAGYPLHLIIISNTNSNNIQAIKKNNPTIIFINNGIHPGEPDGIDASMLLARDIIHNKLKLPPHIALAFIPVYNIGGCLNRSENYRVDQNGPQAFGFRGNSQNLDLNRDFIKADSREAMAFAEIFHLVNPDIFIDNHVSNGADYQHVMTLLSTQHNKLGGAMGEFLNKKMEPAIYHLMKNKGYDLVPYVNFFHGDKVEKGWPAFWDAPRYSDGYAALWNTFAFTPETHMLKPYKQRVSATYALMQSFIEYANENYSTIKQLRKEATEKIKMQHEFAVRWALDSTQPATITFKGYESGMKKSLVSGLPRLYYDRQKPYTKQIPFYNTYKPVLTIQKPKAYIIPQGWWKVIDRLKANAVIMRQLPTDTTINVEAYNIERYITATRPYEGHYMNSGVKTSTSKHSMLFKKGDWYIPMNQQANRFLIETLEPVCEDAYFAWNFFDAILQQKEGYSDYSFEDIAGDYLQQHPLLKAKLEERKNLDTSFAKSADAQLNFIYQHSPWMEPGYLRYPIYRVNNE